MPADVGARRVQPIRRPSDLVHLDAAESLSVTAARTTEDRDTAVVLLDGSLRPLRAASIISPTVRYRTLCQVGGSTPEPGEPGPACGDRLGEVDLDHVGGPWNCSDDVMRGHARIPAVQLAQPHEIVLRELVDCGHCPSVELLEVACGGTSTLKCEIEPVALAPRIRAQ